MRILLDLSLKLAFVCVVFTARMVLGCDRLPAGQSLWIRLAAPVSTYTAKPGDHVHAVLTQNLVCDNDIVLAMGSPIEGIVRSKRKVGWGIWHETASLELEFDHATARPGVDVALTARVEEVENARESVKKGVVQGIRSSDTFQGSINSRLIHLPTWNPYSDPYLIAYKAVFPIFPEPEIYYPAGTDIHLRTTKEIACPQVLDSAAQESLLAPKGESDAASKTVSDLAAQAESEKLDELVEQLPYRVTTSKHVNADMLNIIFFGTEDEVTAAFREAGWHNADPVSRHTVMKGLYALLNNSGYEQEPMMTFLLNGKPEDMNWQKSLNSYGRRDHLRIWQWPSTETANSVTSSVTDSIADPTANSIWLSSSTHDTGAVLAVKYKGFVHHISPDIDDERSTVIRDLNFAGCVKSVTYVARPDMPTTTHNATGDVMHTDGSIAVVALQNCQPANPELDSNSKGGLAYRPGNYVFRFIRRQLLTFRNDIFRANIIYGTYDAGRRTVLAFRNPQPKSKPETTSEAKPVAGSD
jgi:hypothetical protein